MSACWMIDVTNSSFPEKDRTGLCSKRLMISYRDTEKQPIHIIQ